MARLLALHRDEDGALSVDYMLVLVMIVMPLATMMPFFFGMIRDYASRVANGVALPFP